MYMYMYITCPTTTRITEIIKLSQTPSHLLLNTLLTPQVVVRHDTLNIRLATFLAAGVAGGSITADLATATVETGWLFGVGGRLVHGGRAWWLPRGLGR